MLNSQPEKKLKSTILAENVKLWDSLSPAQLYLPEATTLIRFDSAWWKQKKNVCLKFTKNGKSKRTFLGIGFKKLTPSFETSQIWFQNKNVHLQMLMDYSVALNE